MAKRTRSQTQNSPAFVKDDKVIFNGKTYLISIVFERPTGVFYALDGRLGLVSESELKRA